MERNRRTDKRDQRIEETTIACMHQHKQLEFIGHFSCWGEERKMKSRTTVNGLTISYNEETDETAFEKNGRRLNLMMGEDKLDLLWKMTPYTRYKNSLLKEQDFHCADCGANLREKKFFLHHDPPKGRKGARYIDFKRLTRNRILCKDCHNSLK
jgi:hypothetical protein